MYRRLAEIAGEYLKKDAQSILKADYKQENGKPKKVRIDTPLR